MFLKEALSPSAVLTAGQPVVQRSANGGEALAPHSSVSTRKKIETARLWEKNVKLSAKE